MRWWNNLIKLPLKTEAGLYSISRVAAVIAAIILALMMLLTVCDVVGRYFFSRPIKGTWEMVGLLLVFAGTWGLGYCQMQKGHISISIILQRFSRRVRAAILSFTYLIGLAAFSVLCWRVFLHAYRFLTVMRGYTSETLEFPFYPFLLGLAIGCALMALILIVDLVRTLAEVARK